MLDKVVRRHGYLRSPEMMSTTGFLMFGHVVNGLCSVDLVLYYDVSEFNGQEPSRAIKGSCRGVFSRSIFRPKCKT